MAAQPHPGRRALPPGDPLRRHAWATTATIPPGKSGCWSTRGGRAPEVEPRAAAAKGADHGRPPRTTAHDRHHRPVRRGEVGGRGHLRGHGLLLHRQPAPADAAPGGASCSPWRAAGSTGWPWCSTCGGARTSSSWARRWSICREIGHPLPAALPGGLRRGARGPLPVDPAAASLSRDSLPEGIERERRLLSPLRDAGRRGHRHHRPVAPGAAAPPGGDAAGRAAERPVVREPRVLRLQATGCPTRPTSCSTRAFCPIPTGCRSCGPHRAGSGGQGLRAGPGRSGDVPGPGGRRSCACSRPAS